MKEQEPYQEILKKLSDAELARYVSQFFSKHNALIIMSFLLVLFSFGYELFNFSLTRDEELAAFRSAGNSLAFLSYGRWGSYLLNLFFIPESSVPYYPFILSLISLALANIIFISGNKYDFKSGLIFSILFLTHPLHTYYLAFNTVNLYIGMGILITVFSYLATREFLNGNHKTLFFTLAALLLAFTIAIYQALLAFYATLLLFHFLSSALSENRYHGKKNLIWDLFLVFLIIIISLAVFKIVGLVFQHYLGTENAGSFSNEYLDRFIGWGKKPFLVIINDLAVAIPSLIYGIGYYGGLSSRSLLLIIPMLIWLLVLTSKLKQNPVIIILLLVLLVLSPFLLMITNGAEVKYRILMALPLMIAMMWYFSYQYAGPVVRNILLAFSLALLISNTYYNTRLFYTDYMVWQADRELAIRMVERIYTLDLPQDKKRIPVVVIGSRDYEQNALFIRSEIHGISFFSGSQGRLLNFFKTLGINELNFIPANKINLGDSLINQMPVWPAKGSVALINGKAVVKLSQPKKATGNNNLKKNGQNKSGRKTVKPSNQRQSG